MQLQNKFVKSYLLGLWLRSSVVYVLVSLITDMANLTNAMMPISGAWSFGIQNMWVYLHSSPHILHVLHCFMVGWVWNNRHLKNSWGKNQIKEKIGEKQKRLTNTNFLFCKVSFQHKLSLFFLCIIKTWKNVCVQKTQNTQKFDDAKKRNEKNKIFVNTKNDDLFCFLFWWNIVLEKKKLLRSHVVVIWAMRIFLLAIENNKFTVQLVKVKNPPQHSSVFFFGNTVFQFSFWTQNSFVKNYFGIWREIAQKTKQKQNFSFILCAISSWVQIWMAWLYTRTFFDSKKANLWQKQFSGECKKKSKLAQNKSIWKWL